MSNPFGQQPAQQNPFPQQGQAPQGQNPFGGAPQGQAPQGQNPFGGAPQGQAPQGQNPFGGAPQGQAPQGQNPFTAQAGVPPQGGQFNGQAAPQQFAQQGQQPMGGDPFGAVPDAPPAVDSIDQKMADEGAVIILYATGYEPNVLSKYPNAKTGAPQYQDKLHANVIVVTGSRAGERIEDAHIYWSRVARQFQNVVGNGTPYLVQLGKDGNAVVANPVNDPQVRAYAAQALA